MDEHWVAGDPGFAVVLRRSARARRISLRVSALDGRVTLSMPKGVSRSVALAFAEEKAPWIRRHLAKQAGRVTVGIGARIPWEGRILPVEAQPGLRRAVAEAGRIAVPPSEAMAGARVRALAKVAARERLTERSQHYANRLGRVFGRITLRDTRSRWGSCTARGDLMYSWRLILAPPEVLDYVAAHEVAHLAHLDHSPAFWATVERLCPDYATHRAWLRGQGAALHAYDFGD